MSPKEFKEGSKEELEFTNLVSDIELREKVGELKLNESDARAVGFMMAQKNGLCKSQRNWFKTLIERKIA